MDDATETGAPVADAPELRKTDPRPKWLVALAITAMLLICSCGSVVFLVLTGIIAEPETVIEHIIRALLGS